MPRVTLTVREGSKFTRHRCDTVGDAIGIVRDEALRLSAGAHGRPVQSLARKMEPVELVVARVEVKVAGGRPWCGRRAGVDVRGDGSLEAYRGGLTRHVVDPLPGEDVFGAVHRALGGSN